MCNNLFSKERGLILSRMILIGGGTYEEIDELNLAAAKMTGKELPNALFIGTALQDSTNPLTSFKKSFKRACTGAQVKKLSIIRNAYTEEEMDALLDWADVIFIGGGNTAFMLEEWQKVKLDEKLQKIQKEDSAVLMGISAGAICWFSLGYTDSDSFSGKEDWEYHLIEPKTAVLDYFFCPHFNDGRREGFIQKAKELGKKAIALEDATAFILENGEISYRSVDGTHHAYEILNGELLQKC